MSYGDEIMAAGQARVLAERTGKRVRITGRRGKPRWSDLWSGLPWIQQPGDSRAGFVDMANGPGCRPYVDYAAGFSWEHGCRYTGWRACDHRGAIAFTPDEVAFARAADVSGAVLVEPHIAEGSNPNKQWGRGKWEALLALLPDVEWIQAGPPGTPVVPGARLVETPTFRLGAAVLAACRAAVLPEGGLHHAAAAIGHERVVTLIGCAPSAHCLAYADQVNFVGPANGCGSWRENAPCCAAYWDGLSPEAVLTALEELLP